VAIHWILTPRFVSSEETGLLAYTSGHHRPSGSYHSDVCDGYFILVTPITSVSCYFAFPLPPLFLVSSQNPFSLHRLRLKIWF